MSNVTELTVILKDSERTFKQKFLEYDEFTMSLGNALLKNRVEEAMKNFNGTPEDISIKVSMVWCN